MNGNRLDSLHYLCGKRWGKRAAMEAFAAAYSLPRRDIETAFGVITTWDHPTRSKTLETTKKLTDTAILGILPLAKSGYEWHYIDTPVNLEYGDYAVSKLGLISVYSRYNTPEENAKTSGVVAGSGVAYRQVKKQPVVQHWSGTTRNKDTGGEYISVNGASFGDIPDGARVAVQITYTP